MNYTSVNNIKYKIIFNNLLMIKRIIKFHMLYVVHFKNKLRELVQKTHSHYINKF